MQEILPGIWTWSVFNEEKRLRFNGHLVANEDGCALIDPPAMSSYDLAQAAKLGHPSVIIITNRHHSRDAMTLAGHFKARILCHELDAVGLPPTVRLGGLFRGGDRLPGGLLVVTLLDQKSPGESALVLRKADAIILGDALIGKPAGSLDLLDADKYKDVGRARDGIRRLLDYPFDTVLVGDGESIVPDGRKAVEAFLARG
jgi:glyoxylase-like metal-dependent hydrolase (beta-lactamase superfamily II)